VWWLKFESRWNRIEKAQARQVRVSPQRVEAIEEFSYTRSEGKWKPAQDWTKGRGKISVVTSIDDRASLTTPGRLDVRSTQLLGWTNEVRLDGSFLTFHNHGMTTLGPLIHSSNRFDAMKLLAPDNRPPVDPPERGRDHLHQFLTYDIDQPARHPIDVVLAVAEGEPPTGGLGYQVYLLADISLRLPNTGRVPEPRIGSVEFPCPKLIDPSSSMQVRRVERRDHLSPRGLHRIRDASVAFSATYDTAKEAIVFRPTSPADSYFTHHDRAGGDDLTYVCSLLIEPKQPLRQLLGDLLTCRVGVTFGSLLSGTQISLHHATGHRDNETPIRAATVVKAAVELDLERAMSRRLFEHRSVLRFPRVLPSSRVLDGIRDSVRATGYRVEIDKLHDADEDGALFGGGLKASRLIEGRPIEMAAFVRGRSRRVERTLEGNGLPRLREELEAGDVEIELYGNVEGDPGLLTSEMNAIHTNLRGRLTPFAEV
jgi:hypothetical protein